MNLLNLKLPYIGEIIKFGTYHDLEVNGWIFTSTTIRDNGLKPPYERIIGIQWFNPKTCEHISHEQMTEIIFKL